MAPMLAIIQFLGVPLCLFIGMLFFYEGVPFVRDIPLIDRVPVLRELAAGRVQAERVKAGDEARRGYVLLAEKTALEIKLAEQTRQARAATLSLEEHRKRLAASQTAEAELSERLEQENAEYEDKLKAAKRRCDIDADDVEWLRRP